MMLTLDNIRYIVEKDNPVKKQRIIPNDTKWRRYRLLSPIDICLSNDKVIHIPSGFEWDGSSTPRFLWPILPPDGDFEIAALIHDYLYRIKPDWSNQKFADYEMYKWSKVVNKALIDNHTRFLGVRIFGWIVYNS